MTKTVIATTMRAKDKMITQGIKRWLHSIFAWWRKSLLLEEDYTKTPETLNISGLQETLLFTTVDGPDAQPAPTGITSVAVEQSEEDIINENVRPTADERPLPVTKSTTEDSDSLPAPSIEEKKVITQEVVTTPTASTAPQEPLEPTQQQRLEFLRYLVERGIVNEG